MSQPQIINIPEIFKDFFACRIVLAANHHYPGNIQRRFRLQNCLSLKSSISRKYSKSFSPAELSYPQVIDIPEIFKDFSRLQKCLNCKSSISRKYSKTFLPAEMYQPQIVSIPKILKVFFACRIVLAANPHYTEHIQSLFRLQKCLSSKPSNIPEIFKDFFACRNVLAANHRLPEICKDFFACRVVLAENHQHPRTIQKHFLPAEMSQPQIIISPGNIQRLLRLQNCLSSKSSVSRNIQRLFRLQSCLSRKSSISGNYSKTFFACRLVVAANHQYSGNIQRLFRLQNSTRSKSSKSRNYLKIFSPAELSQLQIVSIPKILKVFFACRIVLAANHQYPGNIQRLLRLQSCLSSKSSIPRKYSKIFSPAELSRPQIINIPKKLKDLLACRIVLAASHQYPGKIQRLFRPQNCPISKSSISRKYSKTFCLQKCLSRKSSISRKYPKTSSPAELSQQQIINTPEIFKDFFACRIVLAANHQYLGKIQRRFRLQNCLSLKLSIPRKYSKTSSPAELSQQQIIGFPK